MAYVRVVHEVPQERVNNWQLCFQDCEYHYDNGEVNRGYRFIWRRPDGSLQAARGQARIPSKNAMENLIAQAILAGWFNH